MYGFQDFSLDDPCNYYKVISLGKIFKGTEFVGGPMVDITNTFKGSKFLDPDNGCFGDNILYKYYF
jgi:hypothetical protein